MNARRAWARSELLVAFRLYCRTPFGKLHRLNPEIISLAQLLNRTPSAVAMKACNFATFDPKLRERGVTALANASHADEALWNQFSKNASQVAEEAEAAYVSLTGREDSAPDADIIAPEGPTEEKRMINVRRVQGFFRAAVLASYDFRCALSGIAIPELLTASHIIPWCDAPTRRADPSNGIALNALYDRAFDRGLIAFDESLRVLVSKRLISKSNCVFHHQAFLAIEGQPLQVPVRFAPDPKAIKYHREKIFQYA